MASLRSGAALAPMARRAGAREAAAARLQGLRRRLLPHRRATRLRTSEYLWLPTVGPWMSAAVGQDARRRARRSRRARDVAAPGELVTKSGREALPGAVRCREADRARAPRWTRSPRASPAASRTCCCIRMSRCQRARTRRSRRRTAACARCRPRARSRAAVPPSRHCHRRQGRVHAGRRRWQVRHARSMQGRRDMLGRDCRTAGRPVHEDLRRIHACVRRARERRARVLGRRQLRRRAGAGRHVHRRLGGAVQHVRRAHRRHDRVLGRAEPRHASRRRVRAHRRRVDARMRPAPRRHARLLDATTRSTRRCRHVHAGCRRRHLRSVHAREGRDARLHAAASKDAVTPPPAGTFTQLAGDHQMFCAVATDHHVACWGEPWPGSWGGDNTWPYAKVLGLTPPPPPPAPAPAKPGMIAMTGRIVDEHGRPLANAEVLACARPATLHRRGSAAALEADDRSRRSPPAGRFRPMRSRFVKTGSDGRWSAYVKRPPDAHWGDRLGYVAVAPGREVQIRESSNAADLTGDLTLRPAASVDIDARCGGAACPGAAASRAVAVRVVRRHAHRAAGSRHASDRGRQRLRRARRAPRVRDRHRDVCRRRAARDGHAVAGRHRPDDQGRRRARWLAETAASHHARAATARQAGRSSARRRPMRTATSSCRTSARRRATSKRAGPTRSAQTKVDKVPADHVRVRAVTQQDPQFDD